jgi:transcription initiation factor TFIIH subunit 3
MVYPVAGKEEASLQDPEQMSSGKYEPLVHMNALLGEEIRKTMAEIAGQQVHGASSLPTALSKCLCYIQRCFRETSLGTKLNARILVIMSSVDTASQYVPTMNCIFAAQKHKILIDSCVLWQDSGFLQQASDITGGIYIKSPEPAGLLQFLIWTFLPDMSSREKLMLPSAVQVGYHASCFCHHRLVDVGHVCSVCLSIFCQFTPICSMCQAHFKLPNLPLAKAGKSKKKKNSSKSRDQNRV